MQKRQNIAWVIALLCGGLVAGVGFLVLVGWYTHNLALLHLHPTFVAMAYNTALGFFLSGIGLAALTLRRPHFAIPGAMYGILFGSLTLGEYLFGRDFHIDELFMRAYTTAGVTNNARMAFNTALCLLLMGVFQLLTVRESRSSRLAFVSALIGSLVLGLGVVALTGYTVGVQNYYAWGYFTRMALHTALSFIVLGTGVLAYVWRWGQAEPHPRARWLPIPVGVGGLSLALSLWQALIVEQGLHLQSLRRLAGTSSLPASLLRMNALIPQAALLIGVVLALLLALLVSLAQANQERALNLGRVNRELTQEIRVREQTEAALEQANDNLESRVRERTEETQMLNQHLLRAISETHHRVKNNLQVISALIDMQCMEYAEVVPQREMARLGQHVRSLAVIHDLLTQQAKSGGEAIELDARVMVQKLVPVLQAMLPDRRIKTRLDPVNLATRPGTSLAILINEMVSNATKHGRGDIEIDLSVEESKEESWDGRRGRLTVRDHGPGFAPDFDPKKAAHTGLDLMQSLALWDLQGTLAFENANGGGGQVVVAFPLDVAHTSLSESPQ